MTASGAIGTVPIVPVALAAEARHAVRRGVPAAVAAGTNLYGCGAIRSDAPA